MLNWLKSIIVPSVAGAMFLLGQTASATTVEYYTTGSFSNGTGGGSATIVNGPVINPSGPNYSQTASLKLDGINPATSLTNGLSSTLTYQNSFIHDGFLVSTDVTNGPENVNFGQFKVSSDDTSVAGDIFTGFQFTLSFFQLQPTTGSSSLIGSITGRLKKGTNSTISNLSLTFDPNATYIPNPATGVKYTVMPASGGVLLIAGGNDVTTLQGTVAVPLPKTASMGLAMFGALGVVAGGAALRRRSMAIA